MEISFKCNHKEKKFNKRDIKKSNLFIEIKGFEAGRVNITWYNKKTKEFEVIAVKNISAAKDIDGKKVLVFRKDLFVHTKYLVNVFDDSNNLVKSVPLDFSGRKLLFLIPIVLCGALLCVPFGNGDEGEEGKKPIINIPTIMNSTGNKGEGEFTVDMEKLQEELNNRTQYLNIRISSYIEVNDSKGFFKIYNSNEGKDIQVVFYAYDKAHKQILTDEVLYISPLLHYGENVGEDKLLVDLEEGEHNVVAMFNAYDLEGNFIGNFGQEVLLKINK